MKRISRILETALYVADLERARGFYTQVMGFEDMFRDHRLCALNVGGQSVLLLFLQKASTQPNPVPGGVIPPHDASGHSHLAFAVGEEDLEDWTRRLAGAAVAIESTVHPPRGGTSVYFRDPDGNLVELATPGLWPIY